MTEAEKKSIEFTPTSTNDTCKNEANLLTEQLTSNLNIDSKDKNEGSKVSKIPIPKRSEKTKKFQNEIDVIVQVIK